MIEAAIRGTFTLIHVILWLLWIIPSWLIYNIPYFFVLPYWVVLTEPGGHFGSLEIRKGWYKPCSIASNHYAEVRRTLAGPFLFKSNAIEAMKKYEVI